MQTIIAFIIVFGLIVSFHEFGHFLFAKRAGIMVREFAIGMGPKLFGMTKGETLYTIRLLPLGGYVRMAGEDFDKIELQPGYRIGIILNENNEAKKIYLNQSAQHPNVLFLEVEKADLDKGLWIEGYDEEDCLQRIHVARDASLIENGDETLIAPYDRQFESKSLGKRAMTIFAGPLFNFILAFFLFILVGVLQGVPTYEPVIYDVVDDSPAAAAGMKDGDLVTAIDGEKIEKWQQLTAAVQDNPDKEIQVTVEREGQELNLNMTPKSVTENGMTYGQIGVVYQSPVERNPLKALVFGVQQTWDFTVLIVDALVKLVTGQFSIDALSGPVGIYQATGEVAQSGVYSLIFWTAALSINLGIMNLLPLPALDGGRLLFFGIEAVRGKPVDKKKEGIVHLIGIILLMILMVVVTWNDIQRFFF